jgi:hypothetical protein
MTKRWAAYETLPHRTSIVGLFSAKDQDTARRIAKANWPHATGIYSLARLPNWLLEPRCDWSHAQGPRAALQPEVTR